MISERAAFERALKEAALGRGDVEPNPLVGAVAVEDGRLVGVGHHADYGGAHAEVALLEALGGSLTGRTVFVTLEPCSHQGKTPPCADALVAAQPDRVVVLTEDPNPAVAGRGIARLRAAGIETVVSEDAELRQRERTLNAAYYVHRDRDRAWVIAKWAMTLDGKIASRTGDARWISSESSRREVHRLRAHVDAVMVGVGTALRDDPRLTPRDVELVRRPVRIVLDSRGRLTESARLFEDVERFPVWIATTERAPANWRRAMESRGATVIEEPARNGRVDLAAALVELRRRGCERVLLEGGAELFASGFEEELIDAVEVYVCPRLVGGREAPTPWPGSGRASMAEALTLEHLRWDHLENDQRLRAFVHSPRVGGGPFKRPAERA